jgi:hypothetical protein
MTCVSTLPVSQAFIRENEGWERGGVLGAEYKAAGILPGCFLIEVSLNPTLKR